MAENKWVSLQLFHPYKWSYFSLCIPGFWAHILPKNPDPPRNIAPGKLLFVRTNPNRSLPIESMYAIYVYKYIHLYLVAFLIVNVKINIPYTDAKGLKLARGQQLADLADLADLTFDSSLKVYLKYLHIFFRPLFVT